MRIAISGATGFIGSRLAPKALADGHEINAFGLTSGRAEAPRAAALARVGIGIAPLDLTATIDPAALAGSDVVIHLAAAQHEMNVPDAHFRAVNVEGTRRLIEAAIAAKVRRFVHASTIGVHGEGDGVLSETAPLRPDNIYEATKLEAERVVKGHAGRIETVVVRVPETYGPGDMRLLKLFKGVQKGRFVIVGQGQNRHQPIYVDDMAALLLLLAEHPAAHGIFIAGGPRALTTEAMVAAVRRAIGGTRTPPCLPAAPFLALAWLCERGLRPLGIQPPLHRRRLGFFLKDQPIDAGHVAQILGFTPETDFGEGVARTAAWYRAEGFLPAAPPAARRASMPEYR